jgi:hypothetical protein
MYHLALVGRAVRDARPAPVVVCAAGVDEDVAFLDEGGALLAGSGLAVRDNQLAPVGADDLDLPFLALGNPFRAEDLVAGLDVLAQIELVGDFFQVFVDVLAAGVEAGKVGEG